MFRPINMMTSLQGGCDIVDNCRTKEPGYLFKAYQCDVCECDCLTRCHEGTCGYETSDMDEQQMRDLLRGKPQVTTVCSPPAF